MGMGFAPTCLRQVSPLLHMTTLTTGETTGLGRHNPRHLHSRRRSVHCSRAVASLEEAEGHQHLAGGHGGGCEQNVSHSTAGVRGSRPRIFFLYIFNTKSYILCILWLRK